MRNMSQRAVEGILGRLITDADFRRDFFVEPVATCRAHSPELEDEEIDALAQLDPASLDVLAGCLDPKIVRAPGTSVAPALVARSRR